MGYIRTTHYFFVNYDTTQKRILVNNNLIPDKNLSFDEFKKKCWKQILVNESFDYKPVPITVDQYKLAIGSQELLVICDKYPEIHNFFQNASKIYSCYRSKDLLPDDVPLEEKKCFLNVLKSNGDDIAKAKDLHDTSSLKFEDKLAYFGIKLMSVMASLGVWGYLMAIGLVPPLGGLLLTIGSLASPIVISQIKFSRRFQKNKKNSNQLLSRYQDATREKEIEHKNVLISPVISSFQEICASLEKLPDSVQKREMVKQTKDLLTRYQNAIGDISKLEQESERQSQRLKTESVFNNRLVLLREDILNADQQLRDNADSIQQLQTLNEQLSALLLSGEDMDVASKETDQPKVLRKSTYADQHH